MAWPDVKAVPDGDAARAEIDRYVAGLPDDRRPVVEHLREVIARVAPGAVPAISYQMPAFRYRGKALASFAAATAHLGFYPMSGEIVARHATALAGWATAKGTIRIPYDRPLPDELIEAIVRDRMAAIDARGR